MPVSFYFHQLFHTETCDASIYALPLKRMNSITLPARRSKRNAVGTSRWDAAGVGAGRSVSLVR
jgi:hypothetical protein